MPYADSDFFIALITEDDWLSKNAETILIKHKNDIWTTDWAIIEILMLSKKHGLDPENVVDAIIEIARIKGDVGLIRAAAHLMKEKGMGTFDALHAIACENDRIISSDSVFDKIGLERIKL